jgi:hypothetical protein
VQTRKGRTSSGWPSTASAAYSRCRCVKTLYTGIAYRVLMTRFRRDQLLATTSAAS